MRLLIASLLCAALAGPALAQHKVMSQIFVSPSGEPFRAASDEPYPLAAWFAQADTNHDGAVSFQEFKADALRFFDKLDLNHDGVIDPDETSYYEHNVAPEIILSENGVDEERTVAGPSDYDSAGPDGTTVSGGSSPTDPKKPKTPPLSKTRGAAAFGLINEPEPVSGADGDFNQRITRDEWMEATRSRFDLLDVKKENLFRMADLPEPPIVKFIKKSKR